MKNLIIASILIAFFSCKETKVKVENNTSFFVGTSTKGASKGIYKYEIDKLGNLSEIGLMAETNNPTFLAKSKDNNTLFAVGETKNGFIKSFKILGNALQLLSTQESGGAGPCFVGLSKDNYVLTANYGGGSVGLLKTETSGKLSKLLDVQKHVGKGTTERQKKPRAHSAWFHPIKNEIISVDLGTNELWFSKIDKNKNKLILAENSKLKMADGAGPRHLTFHPNNKWIYVLNELNNTVSFVKEKEDFYEIDSSISMLPNDFTEFSHGADIHISNDGKFLYASNRGHESIIIYSVNPENGTLKLVGFVSVKGKHPRNFSLSPDNKFLLVANRDTNNIVAFKRDENTGKLSFVSEVSAPNPVCIVF